MTLERWWLVFLMGSIDPKPVENWTLFTAFCVAGAIVCLGLCVWRAFRDAFAKGGA